MPFDDDNRGADFRRNKQPAAESHMETTMTDNRDKPEQPALSKRRKRTMVHEPAI